MRDQVKCEHVTALTCDGRDAGMMYASHLQSIEPRSPSKIYLTRNCSLPNPLPWNRYRLRETYDLLQTEANARVTSQIKR